MNAISSRFLLALLPLAALVVGASAAAPGAEEAPSAVPVYAVPAGTPDYIRKAVESPGRTAEHPRAKFTPRPRTGTFVTKDEVIAALRDANVRLVNALSAAEHTGAVTRVKPPGHIPGSINVPAGSLIDPGSHAYLALEELRNHFAAAGALDRERVITYCGGGIAACSDALVLSLLGKNNVAVYDGSLVEWTTDPSLLMQAG